jgi:hypothetical protein
MEASDQLRVKPMDPIAEFIEGSKHLFRPIIDFPATFGQLESASAAEAELQPKAGFQFAHVLADRRTADPQWDFGSGEPTAVDDRLENTQETDIDVGNPAHEDHCRTPFTFSTDSQLNKRSRECAQRGI